MFHFFRRTRSDLRQAIDLFLRDVPADAPIRTVLSSDEVERELVAFDRADARALRKQKRYGRAARVARMAGILGLIVIPLELLPMRLAPPATHIIYGLHALVLTLSFLAVIFLGLRRSALQWKRARVEAENARASVFDNILRAGARHNVLVEALACFKAAHLNWQMGFYTKRISELPERIRRELSLATPFRLMGYALSVAAGGFAAIAVLRFAGDQGWPVPYLHIVTHLLAATDPTHWQYGLKATAMSLLAFAGARLLSHEDLSNSVLYPWAKGQLQRLKDLQLPAVENAAVAGNLDAVLEFRKEVQAILDAESGAWASGTFVPPA